MAREMHRQGLEKRHPLARVAVSVIQLRIDRAIPVIQQLDGKLGEGPAVASQLARLLQGGLPLLGLDAILLVGTILANARDLNEPSHQNSVPK